MPLTRRTLTAALAVLLLAAPTALARPADTPQAVTEAAAPVTPHGPGGTLPRPGRPTVTEQRDVRSPDAIDAATRPVPDRASAPAESRPDAAPKAAADHGIALATIGLGIVGSLLAVGAIAGITSRTRRAGSARIAA